MSETWLTPEEVSELTGLQPNSWAAQRRKLAKMGVPFTPNGAGRPLVERAVVVVRTIARFLELTAMRQADALAVKLTDLDDEGFTYWNAKSKKRQGLEWSDELAATVEDAKRLWRRFGRVYLFESAPKGRHAKRGPGPYTPSGLRALWRVARLKAGLPDVRWHDLRRKTGSDAIEGEASALLGHADARVTARHYRAKPAVVRPLR